MNDRNRDYVFVSYSRASNIDNIIKAFDERGYNVVFDVAMSNGEEWELNVRRYISNEKCKGVVFVLSDAAMVSEAVLTELRYTSRFRKKFFSLLMDNVTLMELYNATSKNLDENKQHILDCIMERLNGEQLFIPVSNIDWKRVLSTFETWGFYPDETSVQRTLITQKYTAEINGEKKRLVQQAQGYYNFDMLAINQVICKLNRDNITVLDLGCSNGILTISRFAENPKIRKVIGIDYNQLDIDEAKKTGNRIW